MTNLYKHYKKIVPELKTELNYNNVMEVPCLSKIVLNVGLSQSDNITKSLEKVVEELTSIAGQKAIKTFAKKSIAGFKLREGMPLGAKVTLRGNSMYYFLERLIAVAIPRIRDFKGLSVKSFDGRGNYNLGIKEHIIFPEIDIDKVDSYHGLNVTIVSTAKDNEAAHLLLKKLGMPFKKDLVKQAS